MPQVLGFPEVLGPAGSGPLGCCPGGCCPGGTGIPEDPGVQGCPGFAEPHHCPGPTCCRSRRWRWRSRRCPGVTDRVARVDAEIDGATLTLVGATWVLFAAAAPATWPMPLPCVALLRTLRSGTPSGRTLGPGFPIEPVGLCALGSGVALALLNRTIALEGLVVVPGVGVGARGVPLRDPAIVGTRRCKSDGATLTLVGRICLLSAAAPATWPMPLPCVTLCSEPSSGLPCGHAAEALGTRWTLALLHRAVALE